MNITLWQDNTSPSVEDTIKVNGTPFDLTGATVKLRMRALASATLKVDAAAAVVAPATNGAVRYDWQTADVDTPGDYLAWWHVSLASGATQDTGEFAVAIRAHAPTGGNFASSDDLESRLGVDFTDDEHDRADQMLELASDLIRDETGLHISLVVDDVLTIPGTTDDRIELPQRPVVSVSSVLLDGRPLTQGTDWYLEGDTIFRIATPLQIIDGDQLADTYAYPFGGGFGTPDRTLAITYTHGYDAIPGTVKAICLEAVVRVFVNPGSVARESVGDTATVYDNMRFSPSGLLLTGGEVKKLRRLFPRGLGSVQVGS